MIIPNKLARTLTWTALIVTLFFSSLHLSWRVFTKLDFLYSTWYELMEVDLLIEKIGPRHKYKRNFHLTTKGEHLRLFSAINFAVHSNPNHLSIISYLDKDFKPIDKMLTHAEITHLKDVSELIRKAQFAGWTCLAITLLLGSIILYRQVEPPPKFTIFKIIIFSFISTLAFLFILGPVNIFYQFHSWVFPQEHQWFFYYEESLMSLIMYAPYLFGYISALLFTTSMVITAIVLVALSHWMNRIKITCG